MFLMISYQLLHLLLIVKKIHRQAINEAMMDQL